MIISTVFNIDDDIKLPEIERIVIADILHRLKSSIHEYSRLIVGINYTNTVLDNSIKYKVTLDEFVKYKISEYQQLLSSYDISDTCEFIFEKPTNIILSKLLNSKFVYKENEIYKFKLSLLKQDVIDYYGMHPGFISNNKPNLDLKDMVLTNQDGTFTDDLNMIFTQLSIQSQEHITCTSNDNINLYCVNLLAICLATNITPPNRILIIKENKSDNFNKSNLLRYCSIEKDFEILTIFRNFIYDVTLHSANESTRIIRPVYPKETDFDMITKSSSMMYEYITKMEQFNFEDANKIINNIINTTNNYYSNEIKQEINQDRFDTIMWTCLEMIRRISLLLHPIIPEFSENILNYLDIEKEKQSLHFFDDSLTLQKMIAEPLYLRLA